MLLLFSCMFLECGRLTHQCEGSHCYHLLTGQSGGWTHSEATTRCQQLHGGHVTTVTSQNDVLRFRNMLEQNGITQAWQGVTLEKIPSR